MGKQVLAIQNDGDKNQTCSNAKPRREISAGFDAIKELLTFYIRPLTGRSSIGGRRPAWPVVGDRRCHDRRDTGRHSNSTNYGHGC
jgi:hypothetical protein